jgi:NADH-quinone oxidoreductase subunit M
VAAAVYSLAMVQRAFHGREISVAKDDASARELWLLGAMAIMLVALGIAPQPILDRISFGMAAQQ